MRIVALTTAILLAAPVSAFAEPTISITIGYPPSVSISGVSPEDIKSGLADRLIDEAVRMLECTTEGIQYSPRCAKD